ncbi:hypothetical protein TYRP_006380 [Tyrophagus putrescentiae]|nr:hypothetical protein TYRP_006380 [Tyrophagus putrescentiae]
MDQKGPPSSSPPQEHEVDAKLSFKSLKSILSKTAKKQQHHSSSSLSMTDSFELDLFYKSSSSSSKGVRKCLLLNYDSFSGNQQDENLPHRSWSTVDVRLLESTLKDHLNFSTVNVQHNLNYRQTVTLLREEAKDVGNRNLDLFLVIILSLQVSQKRSTSGYELAFHTADLPIKLELIVDQITRPTATLAGVPKIFLIECSNIVIENDLQKGGSRLVADAAHEGPQKEERIRQFLIPRYADLLVAYMTSNVLAPEKLRKRGSKAIRLLAHHLRHNSTDFHLMALLTLLAADLQKNEEEFEDGEDKNTSTDHLLQVMSTLTGLVSLQKA